jgi:hypothetical protein
MDAHPLGETKIGRTKRFRQSIRIDIIQRGRGTRGRGVMTKDGRGLRRQ